MILKSPRLEIGPVHTSDAPQFAEWLNDPEVVKYSEHRHYTHSADTQLDYWYSAATVEPNSTNTIRLLTSYAAIGSISVNVDDKNNLANVAIMIGDRTQWGNGYGYEAWKTVCDYLFARKQIRKIEAGCMVANVKMIKICTEYGMSQEAVVPGHFLFDGQPMSMWTFGKFAP
jgi:RimJ/RimL family protein N-acetyltransferase